MTKRWSIIGSLVLAGLGLQTHTFAQSTIKNYNGQVNTITTAVPFLRISPDARSGGMGDVGIATSPDPNSQHWNVAKIPFTKKKMGIAGGVTPWLKEIIPDIYMAYVAGYYKFGAENRQAISASFRYFTLGDITYSDVQGEHIGDGKPRELSFDLGYSNKLSENLSIGVNMRYIHSNLVTGASLTQGMEYKPGKAFAADLGLFYSKTTQIDDFRFNTFSFGAVISNLGQKISYNSSTRDFIPTNLGLGAAYTMQVDEYNKFTLAVDANKLLVPTPIDSSSDPNAYKFYIPNYSVMNGLVKSFGDAPGGFAEEMREIQISIGAEYWYQDQFALRAGYFYEDKTKGNRKYFTVGVGVRYKVFELNGAYLVPSGSGINRNPLANTFRFTLSFEFDSVVDEEGNSIF